MIEDGVLENPSGRHPGPPLRPHPGYGLSERDMLVKYGNITAADDQIDIRIFEKAAMEPSPTSVSTRGGGSLGDQQPAIHHQPGGQARKGGGITLATVRGPRTSSPDEVYIRGTVRNSDMETRAFVFQRIDEILKGTCMAMLIMN